MNRRGSLIRKKQQEEIHDRLDREEYLKHHGVKGMKWGVRRYQPYTKSNQRKGGEGGVFKGKFVGAHKKADAKKEERRVKASNAISKVNRKLDKKAGRFTEAHKKADAKNEASKQKVRDAKAREQEHAEKVWSGVKEKIAEKKAARKQQSVTITDKEGNKSTYIMSSEAAKKYKENAKKQGYKFEQKPVEKKSKKDKQSNKKEENKNKPYVVSEAEEKKQLEVMNKHYDSKTNTLDDEAFIKDWNENYASKFKSANAKTSTTKESGKTPKTPKGQQKVTVTDKDGVSSTYTMDASAAAKFKKKADEQGMKWEQEPVKKKKLKQSALIGELVNDQFLKHGIDLSERYGE